MYPPQGGTDDQGNVFIPFTLTRSEMPDGHWKSTTKKVFSSYGPVIFQNIIITSQGEVFIQYAEKINDTNEFPTDGKTEYVSLVDKDEKRSYE